MSNISDWCFKSIIANADQNQSIISNINEDFFSESRFTMTTYPNYSSNGTCLHCFPSSSSSLPRPKSTTTKAGKHWKEKRREEGGELFGGLPRRSHLMVRSAAAATAAATVPSPPPKTEMSIRRGKGARVFPIVKYSGIHVSKYCSRQVWISRRFSTFWFLGKDLEMVEYPGTQCRVIAPNKP